MAKRKYANPPLQEAICEVHWDLSEPLVKDRLEPLMSVWAGTYPKQKWVQEKKIDFSISAENVEAKPQNLGSRLICRSEDEHRLVQASGVFLAVNQLKPYLGWEESFRGIILDRAKEFDATIGPFGFKRVGLRYIDRIDIPEQPLKWNNWFRFPLPVPDLKDAVAQTFQMKFQSELSAGIRMITNVAWLPAQSVAKFSTVIFDFDVIWEGPRLALAELKGILDRVHLPLGLAFEEYLCDSARELFV